MEEHRDPTDQGRSLPAFIAYLEDPAGLDEESGLPHLSHLACNISFLCEMELADPIGKIVYVDISDEETKKQVYDMWKKWGEQDV